METIRKLVLQEIKEPISEVYHAICAKILLGQKDGKLIAVSGATINSNNSIVAANLAVAMAQIGKKVLLVDCNLRFPKQHIFFKLPNCGLVECLVNGQDFRSYVQLTAQSNLYVLTAGGIVSNPLGIMQSSHMQTLLTVTREEYEYVFLDVPAVGSVADAVVIGTKTDGAVLVVANKEDKLEYVKKAKSILKEANIKIIGCILVKTKTPDFIYE